jgi:molecular chaperone GrpE
MPEDKVSEANASEDIKDTVEDTEETVNATKEAETVDTAQESEATENTEANENKVETENFGECEVCEEEKAQEPDLAAELAAMKEKYLYLQAEYQNYRKRVAKDISDARFFAVSDTLVPFLKVFDYLGMAQVAADKSDNIDSIRAGLNMIIGEFNRAFEDLGVKEVSAVGQVFDPLIHDAVKQEPNETVPEGTVSSQWCSGFKLGDRLLRPARVVVSSGKKKEEALVEDNKTSETTEAEAQQTTSEATEK